MKLPPIIYPSCDVFKSKFVQLYIKEKRVKSPLLALLEEDHERHGMILIRALNSLGLGFEISDDPYLHGLGFPAPKSASYDAVGMGRFDFELKDRLFVAYNLSTDYNLQPNEKHFKGLQKIDKNFKFEIRPFRIL
jgi:hypothetical protein